MRTIPAELVERYRQEGWWTPDTLGDLLARGLAAAPDAEFRVHSDVRPYSGTYADVERSARRLAAGLRERGVGPGDVIAMQLPNWMEAATSFWAAAFLGAVVVPVVHFYGQKELSYILGDAKPKVFLTAALFGHLLHGFASAFQSLGLMHPKVKCLIGWAGIGFAIPINLANSDA